MLTLKLISNRSGKTSIFEVLDAEVTPDPQGGFCVKARKAGAAQPTQYLIKAEAEYNLAYIENAQGRTLQTVRG